MRKWIEVLRKFENLGVKNARVNSILITKSVDLQLFTLLLCSFRVRCDHMRFSVLSPFMEMSMAIAVLNVTFFFLQCNYKCTMCLRSIGGKNQKQLNSSKPEPLNHFILWRVDDSSFFYCLSPFCFLLIEYNFTFSISFKIIPYYVYRERVDNL